MVYGLRIKKIVTLGLIGLLFYFILVVIAQFVSYQYKSSLEKELAKYLNVSSVSIGNILNFPFVSINLNNVTILFEKNGVCKINNLSFYYNPLIIPLKGPVSSIYHISLGKASIQCGLSDIRDYQKKLNSNVNNIVMENVSISGDDIVSSIKMMGSIQSDFYLNQFQLNVKNNNTAIKALVTAHTHMGNSIDYLQAVLKVNLFYRLDNRDGSGMLSFSHVNLGGIKLLQNEDIPFVISNKIILELPQSYLSNKSYEKNKFVFFAIEKEFELNYTQLEEYYLFEHLFNKGNYIFQLSFFTNQNEQGMNLSLNSRTSPDKLIIDVNKKDQIWKLDCNLESSKYGSGALEFNFNQKSIFPSGFMNLRNFIIIPGLKVSGIFDLQPDSNRVKIFGRETEINGGPIGNAFTEMIMETNRLIFDSGRERYNGVMKGFINDNKYELFVEAYDVSGLAIVSNIGFDLLNISKGKYYGKMHVYNDENDDLRLKADADGYNYNLKKGNKKYASTSLSFYNNILSFPKIFFINEGVNVNCEFIITNTNKSVDAVYLSGMAVFQNKYNLPMKGTVFINRLINTVDSKVYLDNDMALFVTLISNRLNFNAMANQYSLSHIGLAGNLNFKYTGDFIGGKIQSLKLDASYYYKKREIKFSFKSSKQDGYLNIERFLLDTKDDKLFGQGRLWQDDDRLFGQIDFIRGGGLSFSCSSENLSGVFQFRNLFIKDFIKENLDVFVSAKLNLSGDLMFPDIQGTIKAVNSANSEKFTLDIPYLRISDNQCIFDEIAFQMADYKANFNLWYSLMNSEYSLGVKGKFIFFDIIKTDCLINYIYQTNQQYLFYDFNNLSISSRIVSNISGEVILKNNQYTFLNKEENGVRGYFNDGEKKKEWNIQLMNKSFQGAFSGSLKNNFIDAEFNLKAPMDVFSFSDLIKDIKGDGKIDLKMKGNINAPVIDGVIQFYQLNLNLNNINTKIKGLNAYLPIVTNKIILDHYIMTTSTGNYLLNGTIDFKNILYPKLNIQIIPGDKNAAALSLNINNPNFKIAGNLIIKELKLEGEITSLEVAGDLMTENSLIYVSSFSFNTNKNNDSGILNNIKWKLPIRLGNGVKFSNELIDVFLKKDDIVTLMGSFNNNSFSIKGNVGVDRGSLIYFGKDFSITEGNAVFAGVAGDIIPYVQLDSSFKYKDDTGENVEVFLTFTGKADNITLKSFQSVPSKTISELSSVIGLNSQNSASDISNKTAVNEGFIPSGLVNVAENAFIFNPLTIDIKRRLGLDLFTIRSGVISGWARRNILGETNINAVDMFEGSTLSLGKYIIPNVFFQYDLLISRNPLSYDEIIPLHTFGLDFDMRLFDLGWKIQPFTEIGKQVKYEQKFEFNFNRRF